MQRQLGLPLKSGPGTPRDSREFSLEPLDGTFRDGASAPLHSWFPFLEGYSPKFVERVYREFLPKSRCIIEPFAGTGTAPIVLGQFGIDCAYSEANPAMAFVVQAKVDALCLSAADRTRIANSLDALARSLNEKLPTLRADEGLRIAYFASFGSSQFFDEHDFECVLKLRSLADELLLQDGNLGRAFIVAVLSTLIPISRLERAGDLRYKTEKELKKRTRDPSQVLANRLQSQALDLRIASPISGRAMSPCETAAQLGTYLEREWEGVITSPPYLNGTNYIRNARLELWFLRVISEKADLRRLRDRVVTSGINDVHSKTISEPACEGVAKVIRELDSRAYDQRIPRMVGGYFQDMCRVLESLHRCLLPRARVCIDIGDSIYAGVHVPTDDLLVEVAVARKYKLISRVHLRQRFSRNRMPVRQQLLVFETSTSGRAGSARRGKSSKEPESHIAQRQATAPRSACSKNWKVFKDELPHQRKPYSKREWGGPGHSVCSYQGKLKPSIAHHLLKAFSVEGDVVIDPFSGAGTIPYESCRMGRYGYGMDISRVGHVLTRAKIESLDLNKLTSLKGTLYDAIADYRVSATERRNAASIQFNSAIPDYFHPRTLAEVLGARAFFLSRWNSSSEWALLMACTMHLLHGNRPYALSRRSHPVTPFKPTGKFEYRPLAPRLDEKILRVLDDLMVIERKFGKSFQSDSTRRWPKGMPKGDAIITSPPFFDSTRFYMTNWMRFWFSGWNRADFESESRKFIEYRQKANLDVYKDFFEAARERINGSGVLVLHLGHSRKCDMGRELVARASPCFSVEDIFTESVSHCETHGIRDKGTVHGHTYLVLRPS